jgi:type IV pilus assembly protein PilQ
MAFAYLISKHGLHYFQQDQTIFIGSQTELTELQRILKNSSGRLPKVLPQQVLIEARIVEADYRFARNLGIKLGLQQTINSQIHTNSTMDLSAGGLNGFEAPVTAITMLRKGAGGY